MRMCVCVDRPTPLRSAGKNGGKAEIKIHCPRRTTDEDGATTMLRVVVSFFFFSISSYLFSLAFIAPPLNARIFNEGVNISPLISSLSFHIVAPHLISLSLSSQPDDGHPDSIKSARDSLNP